MKVSEEEVLPGKYSLSCRRIALKLSERSFAVRTAAEEAKK
jgi:hypothetical protein